MTGRTLLGRAAWLAAVGSALAGGLVALAGWRNRNGVRWVNVSTPGLSVTADVTPREVWLSSCRTADDGGGQPYDETVLYARHGLTVESDINSASTDADFNDAVFADARWSVRWHRLGLARGERTPPVRPSFTAVEVPTWLVVATAAGPVVLLATDRARRRRRRADGRCAACGYDLRATPDRCPECGAAAVTAAGGRSSAP